MLQDQPLHNPSVLFWELQCGFITPVSAVVVAAVQLKSPGLQREMIIAALSDPEVFGILESKVDLVSLAGCHDAQHTRTHAAQLISKLWVVNGLDQIHNAFAHLLHLHLA